MPEPLAFLLLRGVRLLVVLLALGAVTSRHYVPESRSPRSELSLSAASAKELGAATASVARAEAKGNRLTLAERLSPQLLALRGVPSFFRGRPTGVSLVAALPPAWDPPTRLRKRIPRMSSGDPPRAPQSSSFVVPAG